MVVSFYQIVVKLCHYIGLASHFTSLVHNKSKRLDDDKNRSRHRCAFIHTG
ncbi:hypothetical protein AO377_0073 [Moraxella catarrhalis]|nr:hypothetical protein AO377_0073 [Moraxella catarrhalis]